MFEKIKYWWDNDSLFGYRAGYTMLHPLVIVNGISNEIKWAWQRVFRGWDDRVIWSIDWYLAKNIPVWVNQLKKNKIGIPMVCFDKDDWDGNFQIKPGREKIAEERWNNILTKISIGFEAYIQAETCYDDYKQQELINKFEEAFKLFREYFVELWD